MKTLSDDITLSLSTTQLTSGYVTTTIYYGSIGVFVGRTYVDAQHTPVDIYLNDFIIQNHGRNDFLKLNNDGELVSNELDPGAEQHTKFETGQIGNYGATLYDGEHISNTNIKVVAAYNYPNKDIEPKIIDNDSSSEIGRIMQGCDWYVNYEDGAGRFDNLLIPHLPAIPTKKFGMGLQIYNSGDAGMPFALRSSYGINEYSVGYAENDSNATFVTLYDLYQNIYINDAEDTSIFLKYEGTSGDEFGDWQEGIEWYKGKAHLDSITVLGYKDGVVTDLGTHDEGATFNSYVWKYILATNPGWDIEKIREGERDVYTTDWTTSEIARNLTNEYIAKYQEERLPRSAQPEFKYDYITGTPHFSIVMDEKQEPDEYIGKCTIAVLDSCYSRYYLAWMDRFGDVQSQAFDGKIEYTEDFERNEVKDYKLRRRIIHNELQPKWKLNTKWLKEDIYPMYESIFTSPYLLLYDTETDRSWNVILTDSNYKEKTFKTEKKLFNLEITVECNQKQNYIF